MIVSPIFSERRGAVFPDYPDRRSSIAAEYLNRRSMYNKNGMSLTARAIALLDIPVAWHTFGMLSRTPGIRNRNETICLDFQCRNGHNLLHLSSAIPAEPSSPSMVAPV